MAIKRFSPQGGSLEGAMYESATGKYVRYEDIAPEISRLIGEADDLRRDCQVFDEKTAAQDIRLGYLDWMRKRLRKHMVHLDSMNPVLGREPHYKRLLEVIRDLLDGRGYKK
jgi:hypothetical protein